MGRGMGGTKYSELKIFRQCPHVLFKNEKNENRANFLSNYPVFRKSSVSFESSLSSPARPSDKSSAKMASVAN
jgi:hypothetical protein